VHVADQAAAAADVARVDELLAEHRSALKLVERARRRLRVVVAWHERVAGVVEAMPRLVKTGSRGRLQVKAGAGVRSRAWALLADFLARDGVERQERGLSARGRPSQVPRVVGVMAVAASYESGRESMAGLDWTAMFAGVAARTVTTGWARTVELGCTVRIEKGRILRVDERRELGRHRQRAVYDFTALHLSPVDRGPYLGAAARVLAQLLERAVQLVDEHQVLVDDAVAEASAVEAELLDAQAWMAEQTGRDLVLRATVDLLWAEDAAQALEAAHVARARASRAAHSPVDQLARTAAPRAVRDARAARTQAVDNAFEQASRMANFCYQPRRGQLRNFTSGQQFWVKTSARSTSPLAGARRPNGRGEDQRHVGASRSPMKGTAGLTASRHPRTVYRVSRRSPGEPRGFAELRWAKELAAGLATRWEFLQRYLDAAGGSDARAVAREWGLRLRMIAATLASRLSPDWYERADDVIALVERFAGIHSVIAPGDAHSPLRYLAAMLDRALTNPDAVVPHHSPVREAYERQVLAVETAVAAARTAALRDELDQHDAAAAAERSGPRTGLAAARQVAAGVHGPARVRSSGGLVEGEQTARAQPEHAALANQPAADDRAGSDDWPAVRAPGSGLSHRLQR